MSFPLPNTSEEKVMGIAIGMRGMIRRIMHIFLVITLYIFRLQYIHIILLASFKFLLLNNLVKAISAKWVIIILLW
jgi:hypothetical protein